MEARVNSEMLIYCSKTSNWAIYETKEYIHWMTGTVGLAIRTIPPVCPVIKSQHRTAEKPSKHCRKSSAVADVSVVQG